jgi:UDP-GlcNAc:undecaprenyl-phosphate/decaprenyl-phosphate GlcNAc-1-phosphate transferase
MTHLLPAAGNLFYGFILSFLICWLLLPVLIRLSPFLGLVDRPNSRKVHRQLIPAIGGLTIVLAMSATALVYPPLQAIFSQYAPLTIALVVLSITGVVDDRVNSPALLRLLIQVGCATLVAHYGIRLTTLHGVFGITELPLFFQYMITVLILTGMANAFNLIDGIDGLAGSMALVNCMLLGLLALLSGQRFWFPFLFSLAGRAAYS